MTTPSVIGALRVNLGANSAEFSNGLRKATGELQSFGRAANTNTAPLGAFKSQIQNTSFQIQDIAVQIGGGTSALRAFSQQLPQLLSGFGMFGAVAGTVAAVGLSLAGSLMGSRKEAISVDEAIKKLNETMGRAKEATELLDLSQEDLAKRFGSVAMGIEVILGQAGDAMKSAVADAQTLGAAVLRPLETAIANARIAEELRAASAGAEAVYDDVAAIGEAFGLPADRARVLLEHMRDFNAATTAPAMSRALAAVFAQLTAWSTELGGLTPKTEAFRASISAALDKIGESVDKTDDLTKSMSAAADQAARLADERRRAVEVYQEYGKSRAHSDRVTTAREEAAELDDFVGKIDRAIETAPRVAPREPSTGGGGGGGGGRRSSASSGLARVSDEVKAAQQHLQGLVDQVDRLGQVDLRNAEMAADRFGSTWANAIGGAIAGTQSLRESLASIAADFGTGLLQSGLSSLAQNSGLGSVLANFGGFRAAGGQVRAGLAYMTGEAGPEMFVPDRPGTIIPNHDLALGDMGGGGTSRVEVVLSKDLVGQILEQAKNQAISISSAQVNTFSRDILRGRLRQIQREPHVR